jgi:hypothetical protein
MIDSEKAGNALYALQGVLIHSREMAGTLKEGAALADLLDYVENLPRLLASKQDETERFRKTLEEIAQRFRCGYILQRFDGKEPMSW